MLHRYTLAVLAACYCFLLVKCIVERKRIIAVEWVLAALICWPFILVDEVMRAFNVEVGALTGLTVFVPLLCLSFAYRCVKNMVIDSPPASKFLLWVPVGLALVCQVPVLFIPQSERLAWLSASPVGHPIENWDIYLAYMITGFGMLIIGILITELVQNYHRHLPCQVVEVQEYRLRWVGGAMGITVGLSFCCILLMTAGAFGFFNIVFWQSLYTVLFAVAMLQVLIALVRPQNVSPSPLDYVRLDELKAEPGVMREVLMRAERTMIEKKAYKIPALTLKHFARDCGVDPTILIIALRLLEKKDFRQFVYKYRLDYAKNVLLHTDADIAVVAKRLGLNSEKFLGEVLVRHMRKSQRHQQSS
ncbi:AraC family transcriptional regulator [Aestuariibacter sp. A3R04]|uniref:helix-turn-helix domain-containing protein n=1 Tax=Aestuariibacter sp. A3R04 TaxID=2841571 RepID=UPI001C092564|nr:DNA mismatch repair protein [Aestuariibacter sp. A3R04]MBU3021134.1 DNA mismatch repair protein [Aestuariibacter sp. A3R04]